MFFVDSYAPSSMICRSFIDEGHKHLSANEYDRAIICFTRAELIACRSKNTDIKILAVMGLMMAYCQNQTPGVARSLAAKLEALIESQDVLRAA